MRRYGLLLCIPSPRAENLYLEWKMLRGYGGREEIQFF